ncbi:hypothetical protein H7I53_25960 [Mycolicibacterium pulveris]|uniref:Putative lipoprotein LppJ n=2 Tax=Mycolicibacterium pulveris TaxID=36813 RepID=A0A7I7URS6_MYCPV|nr:hypothetical protein [Mycolicibacterium pulveris]MCV6983652.1 hypothetical protein [Mycolicibacterium pulveris]BBY83533.1 putative lipoprotein LppJ [Mycolicibacterium pulveris]
MPNRADWIRSRPSTALLWAAMVLCLLLGAAFVVVNEPVVEAPRQVAEPLTDDQAAAQVVDAARQIVAAAHLPQPTGGYAYVSCKNTHDPPYQAVLYLNFVMPQDNWQYLDDVAAAMAAHGWAPAPTTAEHFGHKLTRNGVTSVLHRQGAGTDVATMRLYGECRNTADHRDDNPAWTEVAFDAP